jgi:nicotinamidase-related amidase
VIDELTPAAGEPVIDKHGYGAFHATDLDQRLHALGVRSLVITGTVTQICVEETAREAFHYGYATTIVADAVSSFAPDLHVAALRNFAMKFGWVAVADVVIAALPSAAER